MGNIELIIKPPETKIYIEATSNDWDFGDISIDDIKIEVGSCNQYQIKSNIIMNDLLEERNHGTVIFFGKFLL